MSVCGTVGVFLYVCEVFSDSVKLTRGEEDQYGEGLTLTGCSCISLDLLVIPVWV